MTNILEKTAGLVAFVRTVDSGSFSTAAKLVGASPSAVSKSVARLERRLNVRLIRRSTRTLRLTAEGQAYYERIAPLLRAIEDAEDVVQRAEDAHGLLRVTVPVDLGRALIGTWAEAFVLCHPRIKLEMSVTDRNVDLIRESYDVAVRIGPLRDTNLVGRAMGELPTVLVASPGYAARRGLPRSRDELNDHACLRYRLAGRPSAYAFADGTELIPDGPLDADDGGTLRQAALSGAGIAHLPSFAVADDLAAGRLVTVLPEIAMRSLPVHVLHTFGRQLPVRARLFIEFLVERTGCRMTAGAAGLLEEPSRNTQIQGHAELRPSGAIARRRASRQTLHNA
ncbi:MAG: LysR family transcriptional regulator [Alphaproteobacteria bacterium]|nr:LysR family transcriptional regulator [Alphaproteobacteria bacterium]